MEKKTQKNDQTDIKLSTEMDKYADAAVHRAL